MGGSTSLGDPSGKFYDLGFSTEFDLVGSNVVLSKLNGNSVLNVTSTSITNSATRTGASSVGSALHGITRTGASGSILATGSNITSITLKMYLKGDGGIVVNNTGTVQTPTAGWEPKWAYAAGYQPPGATTALAGSVGGDVMMFGTSIQKPVTVSGTVFNDTNGLSDSTINGTGTNAGSVNAILVDGSGNVVASTAVAADGTYSFPGIGEGSYSIRLSTTAGVQGSAAPAVSLPATWYSRGEGTAAAGDGTVDGNTAITVSPGIDRTGVNFGIAQPSLSLAKTNPASFAVGTAANYTLTVSNAANRPTSGTSVVVNDKLPPNFAYNSVAASTGATGASCTSSGTLAAGLDLVCTLTTASGIAGGGSAAFTLSVTPQAAAGGVAGSNKAAVDPAGGTPVAPSTCTATGTPAGCAVAASITPLTINVTGYKSVKLTTDADSSGSITPGDTLIYTLQYVNSGTGSSTNFQITDLLPAGIAIASTGAQTVTVSGSGTTASPNTGYTGGIGAAVSNLLTSGATLGAAGVITVTIPVKVNIGFSGSVINQASGTGTGLSTSVFTDNAGVTADLPSVVTSAPYNLTIPAGSVTQTITGTVDTTTFTVSGLPDLKLTKSAPAAVQAGGAMAYTMTVSNVGNGVTFGTTSVKDALPTGVTVNSGAAGSVTLSGAQAANWTCNSDAVSPQSITCTSTTAIAATSGTSVFAFNVNAADTLTTDSINQAKVFGGGDPNKATVTSTGVITACNAASESTSGSAANAGCAYESTPVINVKAYKSVKLITDADASGGISSGDTLNYTIHYINLGSLVTNFQINDQLPTGMTVAATGGQTVLAAGGGTGGVKNPAFTGAASGALSDLIAAGANLNTDGAFTITIPVTINAGFTGTIANQATGFGDQIPPAGIKTDNAGQTSDMSATVTAAPYNMKIPAGSIAQTITGTVDPTTFAVLAVTAPSLTLRKSVNPTGVQLPGTELTYSITFTNTGGSLAREVTLTDPIPIVTDFKIGSVTTDPGSTGLTIVVEYSNDYDSGTPTAATWTYTPVSGGGGAATNFDRDVKAVRWRVTAGFLSSITPDNSGEVGFTVIIR